MTNEERRRIRRIKSTEVNENYVKQMNSREDSKSNIIRTLLILIIIISAILIGLFLIAGNQKFINDTFGEESFISKVFANINKANSGKGEFNLLGLRRQNILLLGVDASENKHDLWTGTRTDTIILLNVDPRTKSVNAISIPRDSKVYLPGNHGIQKINAAHAIGGVGMTIRTIQDTLGVKVDRYIMVHDNAVEAIVEALGGVTVYVEKPMHYDDYAGKLHINLSKGEHKLNPKEAVGYLRFRHDALGDIGRTQRQQWFLRGVLNELQDPKTIAKIPDIISVAHKYVKTNMSLYEMGQYAALAKQIDMDKIEVSMLPGSPNKKGSVSYWILDPEKTQEVLNRVIYRHNVAIEEDVPMNAGVMYGTGHEQEAKIVKDELEALGIKISCSGNLGKTHTKFIAHSRSVTNNYYNQLKKKTPSISGYQFVYEPEGYLCGKTDFTIVVAGK